MSIALVSAICDQHVKIAYSMETPHPILDSGLIDLKPINGLEFFNTTATI